MNTKFLYLSVGLVSFLLSGCASPPSQQQSGMVVGGIVGGLIGSQVGGGHGSTAAAVVGTLIGAAVGGNIGHAMDEQDRMKLTRSLETVQTGTPTNWRNPDTGNQYTFTPTKTYEADSGPCREFTVDGVVGGKREKIYGTACRQRDGSWRTIQ
ncbi:MAG: RT0821/Lpp0805 family surface protein [Undibacterium sp.]|nr:RT0821/Lpp0805 family surface protein [Undibacterium sp.]